MKYGVALATIGVLLGLGLAYINDYIRYRRP
jgi:hypothetical protein